MILNIFIELICLFLAAFVILIFVFTGMTESFKGKYLSKEGIEKVDRINDRLSTFVDGTIAFVVNSIKWFINLDKIEYSNKNTSLLGYESDETINKILCDSLDDIFDCPRIIDKGVDISENYTEYKIKAILKSQETCDIDLIEEKTKNRIIKSFYDNLKFNLREDEICVIYHIAINRLSVYIINNEDGIKELKDLKAPKESDDDDFIDIFADDYDYQKIRMNFGFSYKDYNEWKGRVPISLPISSHCHMLLTGSSGTGKSNAGLWLLSGLLNSASIKAFICDFKDGKEWRFLKKYPYFYSGENCVDGIREFYKQFKNASDNDKKFHLLLLDEYPALITYLTMQDKLNKTKLAIEVQSMVSEILAMGRSLKCGIWILAQRPDASLFANGSRDNFMIQIALGNISREHRQMLFAGCDLPSEKIYKAGEGIMFADGLGIREVKYPLLNDVEKWKFIISKQLLDGALEDAEGIDE